MLCIMISISRRKDMDFCMIPRRVKGIKRKKGIPIDIEDHVYA
jgi:hypothetical protein